MLASGSSDNVGGGAGGRRSRMLGSDGFMAAAIMRLRASMSGFEAGGLAAVLAPADVTAPGGGASPVIPGGRPFSGLAAGAAAGIVAGANHVGRARCVRLAAGRGVKFSTAIAAGHRDRPVHVSRT